MDNKPNIFFSIEEVCVNKNDNTNFIVEELLDELKIINKNNELIFPQIINYKENYTIKELTLICDYYGILKELKINKFNKDQIIQFLVFFELNPKNNDIVSKRLTYWFYINELKNDKFMKKFILW